MNPRRLLHLFGFGLALLAPGSFAAGQTAPDSLIASDGEFEDRVELSWPAPLSDIAEIHIQRDSVLIGIVASPVSKFDDATGDPGAVYTYCVIAVALDGTTTAAVCDTGSRVVFAPTDVAATDALLETEISLTWSDRSERELEYRITRRDLSDPDSVVLATRPANSGFVSDTSAVAGVLYRYCVAAYDADGFSSSVACDSGSRASVTPPSAVSASDGQYPRFVRVTWSDQSDKEDAYVVYRDASALASLPSNETSFDDSTAVVGVTYEYCVVSVVSGEESVPGCDVGGRGTLSPPSQVSATDDRYDDRVTITWRDDTPTEDGFEVVRRDTASRDSSLVATKPANAGTFEDRGALQGVEYVYCVRAFSTADTTATSYSTFVCDPGRRSEVLSPSDVAATDSTYEDRVEITWTSESATAMLSRVYRDSVLIASVPSTQLTYTDHDVDSGIDHLYGVTSVTVVTTSAAAEQAIAGEIERVFAEAALRDGQRRVRLAAGEEIPRTRDEREQEAAVLSAAIDDIVAGSAQSTSGLLVESAASTDTGSRLIHAPSSVAATYDEFEDHVQITWVDESFIEDGYYIYRDSVRIDSVSASRSSFGDYESTPGVEHVYQVSAFDDLGESRREGATGFRRLLPPKALAASDGEFEDRIELTWIDESRAEAGYEVRRDGIILDTTAANAGRYTDVAGIQVGRVHSFEVRAVDGRGASAAVSNSGLAAIRPPESVGASDSYSDRVTINWVDVSAIEDGYRLRRSRRSNAAVDLELELPQDSRTYVDSIGAAVAGVDFRYCVSSYRGLAADTTYSEEFCDVGRSLSGGTQDPTEPPQKYPARTSQSGIAFGSALAIVGDDAFVGLPKASSNSGLAHVWSQDADGVWSFDTSLPRNPTPSGGSRFGGAVGIDSDKGVVGAPGYDKNGGAYFFQRDSGGTWSQLQPGDVFIGDNADPSSTQSDRVGTSAAISGGLAIVGAPDHEEVLGTPNIGGAYIIDLSGSSWQEQEALHKLSDVASELRQDDVFGTAVGISGFRAIVGAPAAPAFPATPGDAYIFEFDGADWNLVALDLLPFVRRENGSEFGAAVAISDDHAIVGAPLADGGLGAVFAFRRDPSAGWILDGEPLLPFASDRQSGARFGDALGLLGNYALVGAPGENGTRGAAYFFERDGSTGVWGDPVRLDADLLGFAADSLDAFGSAVTVGEGYYLIGARGDDDATTDAGAFYSVSFAFTPAAGSPLAVPTQMTASDGLDQSIQIKWQDNAEGEEGYRVYRSDPAGNLVLVATLSENAEVFSDVEAVPGTAYRYCVAAFSGVSAESFHACDAGWRPPNGSIAGRIATPTGGGTVGASVCLDPSPNASLLFDGDGGHLTVPHFDRPEQMTICSWINTTRTDQHIVGWAHSNEVSTVEFRTSTTGQLFYAEWDSTWNPVASSAVVNTGGWEHVCAVRDGGDVQLYVNGARDGSETGVARSVITNTLTIGARTRFDSPEHFFEGRIDEVQIWGRALSQSEIRQRMNASLTEDEDGLLGYWALDQGEGRVTADRASGRHASLADGVFWAETGAPLESCATTDMAGNYSLARLRYGSSTEFLVTPSLGTRSFTPQFKTITLSTNSPVQNEVDFGDNTAFTVSGIVQFEGTQCPVPDVEIYLDDVIRTTTESDGTFSVSVEPSEDEQDVRVLEPRLVDPEDASNKHLFSPADTVLLVQSDVGGVDFVDRKLRSLSGFFGGGCTTDIGAATMKIFTENGCFVREVPVQGEYEELLPPQSYLVQVTNVAVNPAQSHLEADILEFFDRLGAVEVDLTNEDATLDLLYRAPLQVAIEGLPAPPPSCSVLATNDGRELPTVPVLGEFETVPLTISVDEDYGDSLCPLDSALVTIFDEIADAADAPVELEIRNGEAAYETVGISPNVFVGARVDGVDRSLQKSISAVAEVEGREPATATEWVIVEGVRARTGTFVSATTEGMPLLILHDPPGSGSSAFLEGGTKFCTKLSGTATLELSGGASLEAKVGYKQEIIAGTPATGITIETGAGATLELNAKAGLTTAATIGIDICGSTTEKFSTSSDITWVGEDVFVGAALNLIFAEADELSVDDRFCSVDVSETLAMDIDESEPFETAYVYGRTHIEQSLIPALEDLKDLAGNATIDGTVDGVLQSVRLQQAIDSWRHHITIADSLTTEGLDASTLNRSFSGGANLDYNWSRDVSGTIKFETKVWVSLETSRGGTFEAAGTELTVKATTERKLEVAAENENTADTTRTIGYTLSDGDTGDFFSVDVGTDPEYLTPVFGIRSGRSSNPWESGTQKRDLPILSIDPPARFDVSPDEPAVFTLLLTNASESQERRQYAIDIAKGSNPGGAVIGVTGDPLGGETYTIDAGHTQEVTLSVERGPNRYAYENIAVVMYPPQEKEIWLSDPRQPFALSDTVRLSAFFSAPCSDIAILRPLENWLLNAATFGDSLAVVLHEFDLDVSESERVRSLGLEYRHAGASTWLPAAGVQSAALEGGATSWSARWLPPQDGAYEVRAFTDCPLGGKVYSDVRTGTVDTKPPVVFGAPEPSDEILKLGSDISVTFDEAIDCGSAVTTGIGTNVTLTYLDVPIADVSRTITGVEAACNGETLILSPPPAFDWSLAENRPIEARVDGASTGVKDLAGNPLGEDAAWRFTVRRNSFGWSPVTVAERVTVGTEGVIRAGLVNGRPEEVTYSISGLPTWLEASSTAGTLPAGGEATILLTVADTLSLGSYSDTLSATTDRGEAFLYLDVSVVQEAPSWTVDPTAYEFSMTVTGQLFVEGVVSEDPSDVVAAFVGNEVRGVAPVSVDASSNRVNLIVYSNRLGGETVTFRVSDASDGRVYSRTNRTLTFVNGSSQGTPSQPVAINATDVLQQQTVPLAAGWTWVSLNRMPPNSAVAEVLKSVAAQTGDVTKSQTEFSVYDEALGTWAGSLSEIVPGAGYLIRTTGANTLLVEGPEVDPSVAPIDIPVGWSWIGYLPQLPLPINDALASLGPSTDDLIKSQYQFAQYDGSSWVGSLTELQPNLGYMIRSASGGLLTYPANTSAPSLASGGTGSVEGGLASKRSERRAEVGLQQASAATNGDAPGEGRIGDAPAWLVRPSRFAHTMTVTAELSRNSPHGERPMLLGAFVGDEVRGTAWLRRVEAGGRELAFLMIYSNGEEEEDVAFRLYDPEARTTEDLRGLVRFSADASIGSPAEPLVLTLGDKSSPEELPTVFSLSQNYPNPFNPETTIHYELPKSAHVQLIVFDVLGRQLQRLVNEEQQAGRYSVVFDARGIASGMYVYRMEAGDFTATSKMVVLK